MLVLQITPNPHYTLTNEGTSQLDVNRCLKGKGFYSQPLGSVPGPGCLPQFKPPSLYIITAAVVVRFKTTRELQ